MSDGSDLRSTPDEALLRALCEEARDLIQRLEASTVQRLAIQAGDYRIEIERGALTVAAAPAALVSPLPPVGETAEASRGLEADNRAAIVAPLVGTFYRSPQPGAKPFVEEGDLVEKGQPVAIVEAMKIMNQIVAERRGRVVEIVATDGEWVEFQQVLMYLESSETAP